MLLAAPLVMTPFFEPLVWFFINRSNAKGKADGAQENMVQRLMNEGKPTGFVGVKGYAQGGQKRAQSNFESDYEAGIGFTMLSAIAVAGALAKQAAGRGFETPVCAVGGEALKEALLAAGVRIEVDVADVGLRSKL